VKKNIFANIQVVLFLQPAHKSNLTVHQNRPHKPPIGDKEAVEILLSLTPPVTKSDGKKRKKKRKSRRKSRRRTIKRKSL